jgi:hypothetical protein
VLACAEPPPEPQTQDEALRRPTAHTTETYLHLVVPEQSRREVLSRTMSVDRVAGDELWLYASPKDLRRLEAKGLRYQRLPHPGRQTRASMGLFDRSGALRWDHYPTYAEYEALLQQLAADHPDRCSLVLLGSSTRLDRPHQLLALKISDNVGLDEDEPEVLLASTMHGDETVGYVTLLRLAQTLLSEYGQAPAVTELVDEVELWVMPLLNPDGTYFGSNDSVGLAIRNYTEPSGAEAWVDPNRNFPDPAYGAHPDGLPWWKETSTLMSFFESRQFVLAANFHGGAELVNYPWDHKPTAHPDELWFIERSRDYAEQCQSNGPPKYMRDEQNGISNGYAWYQVTGSMQDYQLYFERTRALTIELSSEKNPPASWLDGYWVANRDALFGLVGSSLRGVRGLVRDPLGAPLTAKVSVVGLDVAAEHSELYTDPELGNYHRLLLPGSYTLEFTALGYVSQRLGPIAVGPGPATRLDVVMQPAARSELRGTVRDERGSVLPDVELSLLAELPTARSGRSGRFWLSDVPEGEYTLTAQREGYGQLSQRVELLPGANNLQLVLKRLMTWWSSDFESDNGLLAAVGGWSWGAASGVGSHSGNRVWATSLSGNYRDDATLSLSLSIPRLPEGARLTFWHRYAIEPGWDGGALRISLDKGSSFVTLEPQGGYPYGMVDALGGPGFSGDSDGWRLVELDLSSHVGAPALIQWVFASDSAVNERGWFIDDVRLEGHK